MPENLRSAILLFTLLNPFLVIIYLVDVVEKLDRRRFTLVLLRAALITTAVFCCFAILGDTIFTGFIQAEFASFQIFGGVVFLLIGLQFVFKGPKAIELLRGESENLAGAIAMPVLIGPGTLSASVIIGKRHDAINACAIVAGSIFATVVIMILLKLLHDVVKSKNTSLVDRYVEIVGRITALYVGTVSVEMIMQGTRTWVSHF